jgi:hypothetical protein
VSRAALSIFKGLRHAVLNHALQATDTNPAKAPGIRFHRATEKYSVRAPTIDVRIMTELPYFEPHFAGRVF